MFIHRRLKYIPNTTKARCKFVQAFARHLKISDHLTFYSVPGSVHVFSFRFSSPRSVGFFLLLFSDQLSLSFPLLFHPKYPVCHLKRWAYCHPMNCMFERTKEMATIEWPWSTGHYGDSHQVFPYCALAELLKAALITSVPTAICVPAILHRDWQLKGFLLGLQFTCGPPSTVTLKSPGDRIAHGEALLR